MTDIDLPPGLVHQGSGIVARWPGVVVVIPHDPAHHDAVTEMFGELGANPDPADVVRAIRELTIDQVTLTSAAYLMEATGGPLAFAHGGTEILIDGEVALSGNGGPNEIHINTGSRFTLRSTGDAPGDPVLPSDLRRGVTPGAGITLGEGAVRSTDVSPAPDHDPKTSATKPPLSSPEAEPERIEIPFRYELLIGLDPSSVTPRAALPIVEKRPVDDEVTSDEPRGGSGSLAAYPPPEAPAVPDTVPPLGGATEVVTPQVPAREPLPEEPPADTVPPEEQGVLVQGIRCINEHFNNPNAAFCMICGISMVQQTHTLLPGARPPLGFIVFDDGSTFGLDRSYVVGREPGSTDDPHTDPLTIQDNNETLSRRHAEIRLIDWTVHIVDLGSTNGTFIWDPAASRWNPIPVNQPIPLSSGSTVALGRRTFVFESATR